MEPLELVRVLLSDPVYSAGVSTTAFLTGILIGNWIAIGRDKRKEYNEAAEPIRSIFLMFREHPTRSYGEPTVVEVDRLMQRSPRRKRRGLSMALDRYKRAKKDAYYQDTTDGEWFYRDTHEVRRSIEEILSYTNPR